MVKKRARKKPKKSVKSRLVRSSKKRINLVFRRLIFFVILFVLFLVLNLVTSSELWNNFFGIMALIMAFISVGLLIVLLILWFMKLMKK